MQPLPLRWFLGALMVCALLPAMASAQADANDMTKEEFYRGQIVSVSQRTEQAEDETSGTQLLTIRLTSGPERGSLIDVRNGVLTNREDLAFKKGEEIVVSKFTRADGSVEYLARERYRLPGLVWAFALFLGLAIALGGMRGVSSFAGLVVSVLLLAKVIIPWIIAGGNPLLVSIVGSFLIATASLYLAHGFNKRTSVALASTLITLVLSIFVALLFVRIARLFGMGSEEVVFLQLGQFQNLSFRGLLLGGIIIGSLGVLDDITTAQTAVVEEISKANPSLTARQLMRSGMSVGREHIASLINTLALAYVGASLPLLLLFSTDTDSPLWVILNSEAIAEELIRTLVGSATLLLGVPIATWLAVLLLRVDPGSRPVMGHGHHH